MPKLTVACVLKSGHWAKSKLPGGYHADHVTRLSNQVSKHLSIPYRFVCLSDINVPCEKVPLEHGWPGWWSKMELFKLPGPVLYIDLDTLIINSIDELVSHEEEFVVLKNLSSMKVGRIGSGVMYWRGDMSYLYHTFKQNPDFYMRDYATQSHRWGDQGFVQEHAQNWAYWQDLFPYYIRSIKLQAEHPDNRILCLHGVGKDKFM